VPDPNVSIIPVQRFEETGVRTTAGGNEGPNGNPAPVRTLKQIKNAAGEVLVPTDVPAGFTLSLSGLLRGDAPLLDYRHPGGTAIIIRQHKRKGGKVRPMQGAVETITVGPLPGYVVRGSWTQTSHGPGQPLSEPVWNENAAL